MDSFGEDTCRPAQSRGLAGDGRRSRAGPGSAFPRGPSGWPRSCGNPLSPQTKGTEREGLQGRVLVSVDLGGHTPVPRTRGLFPSGPDVHRLCQRVSTTVHARSVRFSSHFITKIVSVKKGMMCKGAPGVCCPEEGRDIVQHR